MTKRAINSLRKPALGRAFGSFQENSAAIQRRVFVFSFLELKELFNFVLKVKGFVGWAEAINDLAGSVDEEFSEVPEDEAGFVSGSFV